jgi:hypothetical protein
LVEELPPPQLLRLDSKTALQTSRLQNRNIPDRSATLFIPMAVAAYVLINPDSVPSTRGCCIQMQIFRLRLGKNETPG